ncbi:MAG TPA: MBL fold metallo-hydrolase [Actinomycetota bacterium]|nr:MBL fold metallo-hydrolase [Actinomycetota bacterium]
MIEPVRSKTGRAYLLEHRGVLTLVDTGFTGSLPRIRAAAGRLGRSLEDIRQVVLTHCHGDHAGEAARLREAFGTGLVAGAADLGVLEGRDPYPFAPNPVMRTAYGFLQRYRRFTPDVLLSERAELDGGLEAIPAPGHTPGHVAVWAPDHGALFAGDAAWNLGWLRPDWAWFSQDPARSRETLHELAGLRPASLWLGHGPPVRRGAADRLRDLTR